MSVPAHFICPCCWAVSYHPADIEHRYCGRCHWPAGDPELGPQHLAGPCPQRRPPAMRPFIPPPKDELDTKTQEAITEWAAILTDPGPWLKARTPEILGIGVILAAQFPDVPAVTLGRILASASMALGAICKASDMTGSPLDPWDLASYLGLAGTRLAAVGGEMTAAQGEGT